MKSNTYFSKSEMALFESHNPIFNESQMKIINRKTPDSAIEIKTDKNGNKYKSVKADFVKAIVMLATGGRYDFHIISEDYIPIANEIRVKSRLTIFSNSIPFIREQIGQHYLTLRTEIIGNISKLIPCDFGNAYKAAASDSFKKCASEFGFCWDIYGQDHAETKTELPPLNHAEKKKLERLEHFLKEALTADEIERVYNVFLETASESEGSKLLLSTHLQRFLIKKD